MALPRVGDEVAATDLDVDAARRELARTKSCTGLVGEPNELRPQPRVVGDVDVESLLGADLLFITIGDHRPLVDSSGALLHSLRVASEDGSQSRRARHAQVSERAYAECLDLGRGLRAEAEELADRQRVEHRVDLLQPHGHETVRLAQVRGDLGDELVGGYTDRCGELGALADQPLDFPCDVLGVTQRGRAGRHVEKGFVEGQALHQRSELVEHLEDLLRHRRIVADARRHAHRVWAAAQCFANRHRRVNSVGANLVARGGYYSTRAGSPDDHGTASQRRVVALLHGRVEGVHIHVKDGPAVHAA